MNKMKTIYISGKVTNLDEAATEKRFKEAERYLFNKGYQALNPILYVTELIKRGKVDKDDRDAIMRELVAVMVRCDTIYILDGWNGSEGVEQELKVARAMGFEVIFENQNKI